MNELEFGMLIRPNGEYHAQHPGYSEKFTKIDVQHMLNYGSGGNYEEVFVTHFDIDSEDWEIVNAEGEVTKVSGGIMLVDSDGVAKGLPFNKEASLIAGQRIVGNALLVPGGMF